MSVPFPITPEYFDANLSQPDATWPADPNVPEMPPIPTTDPPFPQDNWLNIHQIESKGD